MAEASAVLKPLIFKGITFPVSVGATMFVTSASIAAVGAHGYGGLAVVSTLFMLVPFADLGLGAAVVNSVAGDPIAMRNAVLGSTFRILWIPALLIIAVGFSGNYLFSWSGLLGISDSGITNLNLATAACLTTFAIAVPLSIGTRILIGAGRNDLSVLLSLVNSLATVAFVAFLQFFHIGGAWYSAAVPFGLLVSNLVSLVIGLRVLKLPGRDFVRPQKRAPIGKLFDQGIPMLVIMAGLPIIFVAQRIILAHRSSPIELSNYSLAMQLYSPSWAFISIAGISLWPIFAGRRTTATSSNLRSTYFLFLAIGAVLAIAIVVAGAPVANLLSGNQLHLAAPLLLATGALVVAQSLQQVPGMYLTDVRGLRFQAFCISIAAPTVAGLVWWTAPDLGAVSPMIFAALSVTLIQLVPGMLRVRWLQKNKL